MFRKILPSLSILLLWVTGHIGSASAERGSRIRLELVDGGYENLLIGISPRVPEDPALLDRIKFVVEETSRFLFKATNQRAYFKKVHILVPDSWSDSADYSDAMWQRYDQSDIRIDTPSETTGNRPYTNKPTPCGEPGLFIQLTPEYVLSENTAGRYGEYGKTLVHEWAHYRWGVFDEFPLENGQHFYSDANGNIQAVRCVSAIQGKRVNPRNGYGPCEIDDYGLPERNCRFLDNTADTSYTGSLMYKQFLPSISTFCEKSGNDVNQGNVHNREAPNLQNTQCQGKSIWEVMLEHRDFAPNKGENDVTGKGGSNGPGEPVPEFTVVRKQSSRLVLVLDSSGSMKGQRLRQLRQAAELLISQILLDGEQLGIVEFNAEAEVNSELQPINDVNRDRLLSKVPEIANGATSIGAGIKAGLLVLAGNSARIEDGVSILLGDPTIIEAAAGGKLLVISDGEENRAPYISDILPLVNGSGVTIDVIAIGQQAAPNLELLSSVTCGNAYYHQEEKNSLGDTFSKSSTTGKDITSTPITLYSDFVKIPSGQNFTDMVFIDATVGRNTQFQFGYTNDGGIVVRVTDPNGTVLAEGFPGYVVNTDFKQIRISVPDNATIGLWEFEVQNRGTSEENVTVLVQSHAREGQDPIVVNTYWGLDTVAPPEKQSLYVAVGQGYIPVLGAEVTAVVELPCGYGNETTTLRPKDDGIGADVRKADGVYSAFFTEFCGEGRYGVNVEVNNNGQVTTIAIGSIIGVGAAADPEYMGDGGEYAPVRDSRSTGDFRRVTTGGSFRCQESPLCNGTEDVYPPARITDLTASNVDIDNMQITLSFTAPGDDLTSGRASRYIIVMSRKFSDLYDNFVNVPEIPTDSFVSGDVMMPKYAGEREVFVIRVAEVGAFSYSFAVVAIDDEGNRSQPSNIATASARDFRKTPLAVIIGFSVGGVFLLIVLIVLAVCLVRRMRNKAPDDKATTGHPYLNNNRSVEEGRQADVERNRYGDVVFSQDNGEDHLYANVISRKDKDPNWDPNLANNSEGGGANIKTGHVANAKAVFENKGFSLN